MRNVISNLMELQEEAKFLMDCAESGGDQQHAFDLMVDTQNVRDALDLISFIAENIRKELEGAWDE